MDASSALNENLQIKGFSAGNSGPGARASRMRSAVSLASLILCCGTHAQTNEAEESPKLEEVVVTGSLISGRARDGASPVSFVTSEDFQIGGLTSIYEALAPMPAFTGLVGNDTRAGAGGRNEVNLRGLGPDFTLVLVNGRRLARNDLNLMPFAAVERVEVLNDGGSATYGSDALAGVVNVITRRDFDGAELDIRYGAPTEYSGGETQSVSFVGGATGENGSITYAAQVETIDDISSLDHPLGGTDNTILLGGSFDARSERRNPGLITRADGTRLMLSPGFGAGETGSTVGDYVEPYSTLLEKRQISNVQLEREALTLYTSAEHRLAGDYLEVFGDVIYKRQDLDYVDHRGTYLNYTVPAENFYNPFGEDVSVNYLLDYGAEPGRQERPLETIQADITTTMFTAGVRGDLGFLDYEVAFSDYENMERQSHDGLSRRGIEAQLARTDSGALNLLGNAAVTPEQLDPARALFQRSFKNYVRSLTGLIRFSPVSLPGGEVEVALGAERRTSGFSFLRDEALNIFSDAASLTYLNDPSTALSAKVEAFFGEVMIPIFGDQNARPGFQSLEVGFAVRQEDISRFGEATVPRYSVRWSPLSDDSVILRASFSESFRAPGLQDLAPEGDRNTDQFVDPLILDAQGNPALYNIEWERGGNPDLDATEAEYLNLGIIYRPAAVPGLTASLDYWDLSQTEAFVRPGPQNIIDGVTPGGLVRSGSLTPGDNYAGAPVGRIEFINARIQNASSRDVSGIDLELGYEFDTQRFGFWNANLMVSRVNEFKFDQRDGNGEIDGLGAYSGFGPIPEHRASFSLTNRYGGLTSRLLLAYEDSVTPLWNEPKLKSMLKTDVTLSYELGRDAGNLLEGTTLRLSADNVFDEQAPYFWWELRGVVGSWHQTQFWPGRVVTAGLTKKF